jgi:hypothetical protein
MYKLFIKYRDGKEFNERMSEEQLRKVLKSKSKRPISWAKVTTPSGVTRDVTNVLSA